MSSLAEQFAKIRQEFPALEQKVNGHSLVYLDSAATTLKPRSVVERMSHFYLYESSNVHRGAHYLSDKATQAFEQSRTKVAQFINAKSSEEIIFVRGTTEAINLVAQAYLLPILNENDEILITEMEHHANIVPWQMVAEQKNAHVKMTRVLDNGEFDYEDLEKQLSERVKLVAVTACSNTLGTVIDVQKVCKLAHRVGAKVLVDGAQWVAQSVTDVQKMGCDFFAFSAHKIFGPFGLGVLYGRREILDAMGPYQGGGSMISQVALAKTTYNDVPYRFEAGTPHIAGAIGLEAALLFVEDIGLNRIHQWDAELLKTATEMLSEIPNIQIMGQAANKGAILSFNLKGAHHSDVSQILDKMGIAVRAGHHCTQPLMQKMGVSGTVRASFSIYNNHHDIEVLIQGIVKAQELLL